MRTLRRACSVAFETGYLARIPTIELSKHERHRDRVITLEEQVAYFRVARQPCYDVALLILKEGTRPDEVFRLDWRDVNLAMESMIMVRSGKTKNAKRNLPLTKETYESLLQRYVEQGRPKEGWVFSSRYPIGAHYRIVDSQTALQSDQRGET